MRQRLKHSTMPTLTRERARHRGPLAVGALVFVLGLLGSGVAHPEIISVPSEASSSTTAALPPPTVLRGSPLSSANSGPNCPPGYTLAPGYGCVAPSTSEYPSDWQGYDYWPDYGWGWGDGGFPFFRRSHGFAKSHRFGHFGHFAGV